MEWKVKVDVLDFRSLIIGTVSVDVKQHLNSNSYQMSELRSCVKVEVAVLGCPSLIVLNVISVDVKQN